jgi:hypothetical protein
MVADWVKMAAGGLSRFSLFIAAVTLSLGVIAMILISLEAEYLKHIKIRMTK